MLQWFAIFVFAFVWLVSVTGLCCQHSYCSSGCFCFLWEFSLWWFLTPCLSTLFIVFCTSSVYVSQNNNKIWFDVINVLFFLSGEHIACALYIWSELITLRNCHWTTCVSDRLPIHCHVQCSLHGNKHLFSLLQRPNSFHRNYASVLHVEASINSLPSIIWSVTPLADKIITSRCWSFHIIND